MSEFDDALARCQKTGEALEENDINRANTQLNGLATELYSMTEQERQNVLDTYNRNNDSAHLPDAEIVEKYDGPTISFTHVNANGKTENIQDALDPEVRAMNDSPDHQGRPENWMEIENIQPFQLPGAEG